MTEPPDKFKSKDDPKDGGALWAYVTRSIQPLQKQRVSLQGYSVEQIRRTRHDYAESPKTRVSSHVSGVMPATDLDRRTEERFRRGQMRIDAVLDLHGLSAAYAQTTLENFIINAHERDFRCVLVITGKGRRAHENGEIGLLKRSLPGWLGSRALASIVLKHVTAKGKHGGAGAFYVLLRRRR